MVFFFALCLREAQEIPVFLFWFIKVPTLHHEIASPIFISEVDAFYSEQPFLRPPVPAVFHDVVPDGPAKLIFQENKKPVVSRIVCLQNHSVVLYKDFSDFPKKDKTAAELENLEKGKSGDWNGFLSPTTARKIKRSLSAWLTALEQNSIPQKGQTHPNQKPTFVTLTLPAIQKHSDNHVKRAMLGRLITVLQRTYGVKYYFWRAEPQKNDNIHFHLIIDKYVKWQDLRAEWNRVLDGNGYIENYRSNQKQFHKDGFKVKNDWMIQTMERIRDAAAEKKQPYSAKAARIIAISRQKKAYETGMLENWSNPNSTDIHALEGKSSIVAYVVKYVCKVSDNRYNRGESFDDDGEAIGDLTTNDRKIKGRIWGCSDELRKLSYFSDTFSVNTGETEHYEPEFAEYITMVEVEAGRKNIYEDEYVKVIRLEKPQEFYLKKFSPGLHQRYKTHYNAIFKDLYPET